jgi:hypothetical protein
MCISVNPANFSETFIANFPDTGMDENRRVLSYLNTAQRPNTSALVGVADTGPNAMLFAVPGEVTHVADMPDPEASRFWLTHQSGIYQEEWNDGDMIWLGGRGSKTLKISTAGNYLVGIATSVDDIQATLHQLRRVSPHPEHVPDAPDDLLDHVDCHYREQGWAPQFVIAAFALDAGQVEEKNPITVHYTQSEDLAGQLFFPALDYHGMGAFSDMAARDHHLLMATHALNEAFAPAMQRFGVVERPPEFAPAPVQFPFEIIDTRKDDARYMPDAVAPNKDYLIELPPDDQMAKMGQAVRQAPAIDPSDFRSQRAYSHHLDQAAVDRLGTYGLLGRSNQAATTPKAYVAYGSNNEVLTLATGSVKMP